MDVQIENNKPVLLYYITIIMRLFLFILLFGTYTQCNYHIGRGQLGDKWTARYFYSTTIRIFKVTAVITRKIVFFETFRHNTSINFSETFSLAASAFYFLFAFFLRRFGAVIVRNSYMRSVKVYYDTARVTCHYISCTFVFACLLSSRKSFSRERRLISLVSDMGVVPGGRRPSQGRSWFNSHGFPATPF